MVLRPRGKHPWVAGSLEKLYISETEKEFTMARFLQKTLEEKGDWGIYTERPLFKV